MVGIRAGIVIPVLVCSDPRRYGILSMHRVAITREMVRQVQFMVQGMQISAPFGRYQMALNVAEALETGRDPERTVSNPATSSRDRLLFFSK